MAKRKQNATSLNIYLNGLPLGLMEYKAKKDLTFKYKEEWLKRENAFPISRSLPLREESYEGERVFAYFDNLLPDNVSIRQRIAARMWASSDQVFDLLAVVGKDCVGALQFVKPDEPSPTLEDAAGIPISTSEIVSKLKNLRIAPLAVSLEDDFRLSIAGAQEKTAFLRIGEQWNIPLDATPTTHIFKPQIGELKPGLSFTDSVENEWLCSRIVNAFGLPVTECFIETFEDINVLIVKRFDRAWAGNKLIRIPQEDLCQALSIPNYNKYENEGGPGIATIMDMLNESNNRELDRKNFMKTQVVFFLLAAIDGHGKNFSIRWNANKGFNMTPLYDILSAQPLMDEKKIETEKVKMAMAVGDNRYYKVRDIFARHFLQTAKLCKFDVAEMEEIMQQCIDQLPHVISKVTSELDGSFPQDIASSIFEGMNSRLNHLKS